MDQRQLATVLFAVIGVFLAAARLPDLFLQGAMLAQWDPALADRDFPVTQRSVFILGFIASLLTILLGAGLLFLRERLAVWLFPADRRRLATTEAQAVALSVLGCYFLVQGIHGSVWPGWSRWGGITQAVLGAALFLGGRGLARLWASWRPSGEPHEAGEGA